MASLIIVQGENAGKQFELGNRPLSTGREPARDIQLLDPKVSRKHALLRNEGDSYLMAPAKALNGIVINGKQIDAETALSEGDEIALGDTLLRFTTSADPNRTNAVFTRKAADRAAREQRTIM